MMSQIVSGTPLWVWGLLLALFWLGTSQLKPRVVSFRRVVPMALLMAAFSLYGTVSAFGSSAGALACWLAAACTVGWVVLSSTAAKGTRYLSAQRAFEIPGSLVPLALMLGIFVVKYVVGILVAMHAPVVQATLFGPLVGMVYGAFSGAFLGRAGRLMRLAWQTRQLPAGFHADFHMNK